MVAAFLALVACTPDPVGDSQTPAEVAIAESRVLLPDDRLIAAIPEDFELDRIIRNDEQFPEDGWITVGVRLKPDEINYARVIFYVLPTDADARELYDDQPERLSRAYRTIVNKILEGAPRPFSLPDAIQPNVCGLGGAENLWLCHATGGRLYLVTQSSSAKELWPQDFQPGTDDHARRLLTSFGTLLSEVR